MTVDEALETVRIWHVCDIQDYCEDSPACALAAEVHVLRAVIAKYSKWSGIELSEVRAELEV